MMLPARTGIFLSLCAVVIAMASSASAQSAAPTTPETKQPPAKTKQAPAATAAPAASTAAKSTPKPHTANPASKNCTDKGGTLSIEKDGSGGEFGVCTFSNKRQCEEWAMMHGDCRSGGVHVASDSSAAARYCTISGGLYRAGPGDGKTERGSCAFRNGKVCPAADYFNTTCVSGIDKTQAPPPPAADATIRAFFKCAAGQSINATFINKAPASTRLKLSDGRELVLPQATSASGARYANAGDKIVFWNKGNTAFLEEGGKQTYTGCVVK